MKISKSILSPSHGRRHEPPLTLPTSLSRRLKANGQSPATFPGKKRGSGFDNPEPSSPKVTCIGQVKMKTKKKVITQTRSLSNITGERGLLLVQNQKSNCNSSVHFQQPQDRNQRWVHLPLTIYEGLRDFSCLFPCRRSSSCFSTNEKEMETKAANGSRDVVARWLVSLQDVEAEKMESSSRMRSSTRHVFEGVELKEGTVVEEEEEKGRVSICIPPKNALLLMRCRSDPMKMADITNRFLQSPTRKETDEEVEDREEVVDAQNIECRLLLEETVDLVENEENPEAVEVVMEMDEKETEQVDEEEISEIKALAPAEVNSIEQVAESIVDQTTGNIQNNHVPESEKEEEEEDEKFKSTIEKIIEETLLLKDIEEEEEEEANEAITVSKVEYTKESRKQQNESILPDCLLLMMCEPKLSMEVSKETWVCSSSSSSTTDLEAKKVKKKKKNKQVSGEQNKSQPPRSSCSFPAMSSMATMIEHKLLNTLAYEPPLVLTRCKSEPMRVAAAAKLEPGTCFWKNRKIEPHSRATFGFGAAGVGF